MITAGGAGGVHNLRMITVGVPAGDIRRHLAITPALRYRPPAWLTVTRQPVRRSRRGSCSDACEVSGETFTVRPIGVVRSPLHDLEQAPRQADEGAPEAELVFDHEVAAALEGIEAGAVLELLTWLHRASRETLRTRPRGDPARMLTGVFATRSPDRPNPIGLHTVTVVEAGPGTLRVAGLEAIDGTPVIDVKIALGSPDRR